MFSTIVVPTDGSEASAAATEQAIDVAAGRESTVHFLHVVDVGAEMSATGNVAPELTETLEGEAESILDSATAKADEAGVASDREILEGTPHDAIVEYCDVHDADLVVVGASGRSGITDYLLGSTTERVLRSVDGSVLVARP